MRRVLLVDDDSAVREVTPAMLQELGCIVIEAGSGGSALALRSSAPEHDRLGLVFAISWWIGPKMQGRLAFVIPSIIVLVLLAIPPILSGTYAGIEGVDLDARDAAKGMGMRGSDVLLNVELPCALPLVLPGPRIAAPQVIPTARLTPSQRRGGPARPPRTAAILCLLRRPRDPACGAG